VIENQGPSRRSLFTAGALVAAASAGGRRAKAGPRPLPLKIGLASFSMRKQTLDQVIDFCTHAEVRYLTLKDVHLPLSATPEQIHAAMSKVEAAGITVTGGGVIGLKNDPDQVRRAFEYARTARLPLIVASPSPDALDLVEGMIKEYGIPVAIHNHGPEDKHFPTPYDVLAAVKKRDRRFGACMDVGHAVRGGSDPVKCVADLGERLLDLHVKDLKDRTDKGSQTEVGLGVIDIAGLLKALARRHFQGHVALEYEIHTDHPEAGIRESLAYMRGAAAALG
jgi:sugar phosphate isomerase/epimerase